MPRTDSILHETVSYRSDTHILLHSNIETDDYPPHWHTPVELVMPTENHYTAHISNKTYLIQPYEILFITPNTIHRLEAPATGHRYILQADLTILKDVYGISQILSFLGPATLFTPTGSSGIYTQLKRLYLEICDDYFSAEKAKLRGGVLTTVFRNPPSMPD